MKLFLKFYTQYKGTFCAGCLGPPPRRNSGLLRQYLGTMMTVKGHECGCVLAREVSVLH